MMEVCLYMLYVIVVYYVVNVCGECAIFGLSCDGCEAHASVFLPACCLIAYSIGSPTFNQRETRMFCVSVCIYALLFGVSILIRHMASVAMLACAFAVAICLYIFNGKDRYVRLSFRDNQLSYSIVIRIAK